MSFRRNPTPYPELDPDVKSAINFTNSQRRHRRTLKEQRDRCIAYIMAKRRHA